MASKKDDFVQFLMNRLNDGSAAADELMIKGISVSNLSEKVVVVDLSFYEEIEESPIRIIIMEGLHY